MAGQTRFPISHDNLLQTVFTELVFHSPLSKPLDDLKIGFAFLLSDLVFLCKVLKIITCVSGALSFNCRTIFV